MLVRSFLGFCGQKKQIAADRSNGIVTHATIRACSVSFFCWSQMSSWLFAWGLHGAYNHCKPPRAQSNEDLVGGSMGQLYTWCNVVRLQQTHKWERPPATWLVVPSLRGVVEGATFLPSTIKTTCIMNYWPASCSIKSTHHTKTSKQIHQSRNNQTQKPSSLTTTSNSHHYPILIKQPPWPV